MQVIRSSCYRQSDQLIVFFEVCPLVERHYSFINPHTLPQNNKLNCAILPSEGYMDKFVKSNRNHEDNNITICLIRVFDAELVPASFLLQAFR